MAKKKGDKKQQKNQKGKEGRDFKIGNPENEIEKIIEANSKFQIGNTGYDFHLIKRLKPVFAFDYLSMNKTHLCFNSSELKEKDFIGLLEGLKKISPISYDALEKDKSFHFHKIDLDDPKVKLRLQDIKKIFTSKPQEISDEELPSLYQLHLKYNKEARVCGFIYKAVFYLVWFDRKHTIYPRNDR